LLFRISPLAVRRATGSVGKIGSVITDATAAPRRYVLRASSPAGGGRTSSCLPILISLADTCAPPAPYGAGADTQAASHERTESWPCRGASPIWFGLTGFTSRATLHKSCAPNGRGAYRKELLRSKGVGARAAAAAAANSRSSSSSGKIDRERVIDRRRGRRQNDRVSRSNPLSLSRRSDTSSSSSLT